MKRYESHKKVAQNEKIRKSYKSGPGRKKWNSHKSGPKMKKI